MTVSPLPSDYYELLGLERKLGISQEELQRRYYELSRQFHPDRFMRKSDAERQYALDASSAVNDAYRTLKEPVRRAEYVLKQGGFDIGEQRSKDVPPELLEEVFELNMALEEMRAGDESARPQLESARTNFTGMLSNVDRELEKLFQAYDVSANREQLSQMRGDLNRRRYIQNLVREVQKELDKQHVEL